MYSCANGPRQAGKMTRSPVTFRRISLLCAVASACIGVASSSSSSSSSDGRGGFGAALWSALDGCFGRLDPAAVCLKYKALSALDRALAKPVLVVADGVRLAARDGKSRPVDPQRADRAALEAAVDADRRNALLDEMLAGRAAEFVSTRTVVLDASAEQQGRGGKKKKSKIFRRALAMAGLLILSVAGSVIFKSITLTALTALLASKFTLVLYTVMTLGKILQDHKNSSPGKYQYFDRVMELDKHDTAAAYQSAAR